MDSVRGPGQRAGLSQPAVLAAARELLATAGVDGLTMRALARRLDVAPNALYSHVRSKTDLLDALLDDLPGQRYQHQPPQWTIRWPGWPP